MAEADTADSWLVYKIVDIVRHRSVQHRTVIATGILTNILVIISVLSAFPWIRKSVSLDAPLRVAAADPPNSYHHNVFERHHRFIGWLGLAVCTMRLF